MTFYLMTKLTRLLQFCRYCLKATPSLQRYGGKIFPPHSVLIIFCATPLAVLLDIGGKKGLKSRNLTRRNLNGLSDLAAGHNHG